MRICAAQTRPVKGNIPANIRDHERRIERAASGGAGMIVFPELSLTGYEPTLAGELAMTPDAVRLDVFQKISDDRRIIIGVGAPTRNDAGVFISTIIFRPHRPRGVYSKKYLHPDEEKFFAHGRNSNVLIDEKARIALAICYELSVPEHAERAFESRAKIYLATAAKTERGVDEADKRLSAIADKYSMTVLMANCVGECDGVECAGGSSAWNDEGVWIGRLDAAGEGLLIFDTHAQELVEKMI